uniref:Uncharacterized protein n=1 Tax=Knipowitschia caucasica TaxID=637954 RepID=A0AAV2MNN6_KNICA
MHASTFGPPPRPGLCLVRPFVSFQPSITSSWIEGSWGWPGLVLTEAYRPVTNERITVPPPPRPRASPPAARLGQLPVTAGVMGEHGEPCISGLSASVDPCGHCTP